MKDRNGICDCGSGLKRKRCLPSHPPVGEALDLLWMEALQENVERSRTPEERRARHMRAVAFAHMVLAVGRLRR